MTANMCPVTGRNKPIWVGGRWGRSTTHVPPVMPHPQTGADLHRNDTGGTWGSKTHGKGLYAPAHYKGCKYKIRAPRAPRIEVDE